jgi:hypothetical protein
MAIATLHTYRVLIAHGYTKNKARFIVRDIYTMHGFGKTGYLRHVS